MRSASRGMVTPASPVADPTGGRALTEAIRAAKVSRNELARATGLSRQTIQNLEHGRSQGRAVTWRALAMALGTTAERLVGE